MTTINDETTTATPRVNLTDMARGWISPKTALILVDAVQDGNEVAGRALGTSTQMRLPAHEFVPLPLAGEYIDVLGQVSGWYLGITPGTAIIATETVIAEVFDGQTVASTRVPVSGLHARSCVGTQRSLTPVAQRLVEALAQSTQTRNLIQREHTLWVDSLVADMHEAADEANLCEEFDNFMEAHDLETRSRESYVNVTVQIPVTVTVTARNEDDALYEIETNPDLARDALIRDAQHGTPLEIV